MKQLYLLVCFVDVGVCVGAAPSCFCSATEAIAATEDFYSPNLISFRFIALSDQKLLLFVQIIVQMKRSDYKSICVNKVAL